MGLYLRNMTEMEDYIHIYVFIICSHLKIRMVMFFRMNLRPLTLGSSSPESLIKISG